MILKQLMRGKMYVKEENRKIGVAPINLSHLISPVEVLSLSLIRQANQIFRSLRAVQSRVGSPHQIRLSFTAPLAPPLIIPSWCEVGLRRILPNGINHQGNFLLKIRLLHLRLLVIIILHRDFIMLVYWSWKFIL